MAKKFGSLEEKREYQRNIMARWRERNPEKVEAAKETANKRSKEWAQAHPERHAENMARWRREFKERDLEGYKRYENERNKRHRAKIKAEMVRAYGGKCSCKGCTVSLPEFLTMHHSQGDGAAHRAEIFPNTPEQAGHRFYMWLKRNNWPKEGFELHCYNCNCAKGFYGYCPHERDNISASSG